MLEHSAGILPYKFDENKLKVMLTHPGGPYWAKKDDAAWSIPKGLLEEGEDALDAARREFEEETGYEITESLIELGTVKQSSKKQVTIFAIQMDIDVDKVKSNMFEMEWPPKSGKIQQFPENDKAQWFSIEIAHKKIFKGQLFFLEQLERILQYEEPSQEEYKQLSLFD